MLLLIIQLFIVLVLPTCPRGVVDICRLSITLAPKYPKDITDLDLFSLQMYYTWL